MAENTSAEEKAGQLFELLSQEKLTDESKQKIAGMLKDDAKLLTSPEFMEKIALKDMNLCPKEGVAEYIESSANQLKLTSRVLENLNTLHSEGLVEATKNGKTPVQHLIDESKMPNGETLGTQTVKNVMYLRAMQTDPAYPDKKAINALEFDSSFLLEQMYMKDEYGANPNRRNATGQKVGELMKSHLDDKKHLKALTGQTDERQTLTVEQLKAKPYQKTLSREDLLVAKYRGTLTVEQAEQLKKMENNDKEADIKNLPGDWDRPQKRDNNEKFSDGDVVEYMYKDWFLGGASWICNGIENKVLGLIDNAANIFVEASNRNRKLAAEIKDENLKNSINLLNEFDDVVSAVQKGKEDAYTQKSQKFTRIFDDLGNNIDSDNPQWQEQHNPQFIQTLKNDKNRHEFINTGKAKILSDISILQGTDKLATLITQIEMKDEFMRDIDAWKEDKKTLKTKEQLKEELERRSAERHKKMLKAIAVISEDTRLMAEIAYEGIKNPKLSKEEFIRAQVTASIKKFMTQQQEQAQELAQKQVKETEKQNLDGRGPKDTDRSIKKGVKALDKQIDDAIDNGKMYQKDEFTDEKSAQRIEKATSLFEEAKAQNTPCIFEKYGDIIALEADVLAARKQKNTDRKQQLEQFKAKFENRDKKAEIDKRITDMQRGASRD